MNFPRQLLNQVVQGEAIDILRSLPTGSVPVIITDPPWPNCDVSFTADPYQLFADFAVEAARLTERLIVVLGCDTDPRFIATVPAVLPFFRVVWLRRIPGSYRGSLFYSADVAYIFGHRRLNGTDRVIGGESTAVLQKDNDPYSNHPTRRHLEHMSWLVRKFSRPGDIILDPFCGSGSTLVAAKRAGRNYCGFDIEAKYIEYAKIRLEAEQNLFDKPTTLYSRGSFNLKHQSRYKSKHASREKAAKL